MNTLIHLWIEPLVMNHERNAGKVYVNVIVPGDHSALSLESLEDLIGGDKMTDIMDLGNIDSNWNYAVLFGKRTTKAPSITFVDSPEEKEEKETVKKIDKEIAKIVKTKTDLKIDTSNVEIKEGGLISVSIPHLRVAETIDVSKIWATIEKDFIGKIQPGDYVTLTDEQGNELFELRGGNFLNIGVSDLGIYDHKKIKEGGTGLLNKSDALKGGLFLREDGSLEIGDRERTFYLKIHTGRLLKASLRLKKPLMELTQQKLLK